MDIPCSVDRECEGNIKKCTNGTCQPNCDLGFSGFRCEVFNGKAAN